MEWTTLLRNFDADEFEHFGAIIQDQYAPDALLRYFVLSANKLADKAFTHFFATACLVYHADRNARTTFNKWLKSIKFSPLPRIVTLSDSVCSSVAQATRKRTSAPCIGHLTTKGYVECDKKTTRHQCGDCAASHNDPAHHSVAGGYEDACIICADLFSDEVFVMCKHSFSRAHLRCAHANAYKCLVNCKRCTPLFFR